MKKWILIPALLAGASSCHNRDITFDDYERQTVYFPVQYPVRTLSLGNDVVDNSLDRQHKFNIGVCVGGYYDHNKQDWQVNFTVDPSLIPDGYLKNSDGAVLKALPSAYYTLSPSDMVTIPEGSFNGLIEVQLSDTFFEDPLSITGCYAIPLRLTASSGTDNILHGTPASDAPSPPDVHIASHWEVLPMDYTLFGIKYVNRYHGQWLRRGQMVRRNHAGEIVEITVYHAEFVEYGEVVTLATSSLHSVVSGMSVGTDHIELHLLAGQNGSLSVASTAESPVTVSYGSGLYKENGDAWGGTPENPTRRDAIYLNYFYEKIIDSQAYTCEIIDTLVFRDRGIKYEAGRPTVVIN
ncbi:MAG: DUF1735 domain-containing protein [Tannerella sp.]|jgi:hypothetical protein|nr:DUF1735 domain-containing protein [Tannerella sp.]